MPPRFTAVVDPLPSTVPFVGPDLAGRKLSADQFKHAVRQPWGVMPAFTPGISR